MNIINTKDIRARAQVRSLGGPGQQKKTMASQGSLLYQNAQFKRIENSLDGYRVKRLKNKDKLEKILKNIKESKLKNVKRMYEITRTDQDQRESIAHVIELSSQLKTLPIHTPKNGKGLRIETGANHQTIESASSLKKRQGLERLHE